MEPVMLVEVLGGHDRVRARHRVTATLGEVYCTVGRSVACDVVLDDPFVAAVHVQLILDADGTVLVTDLESVNGVEVDGQRLHGVERVPLPGGIVRIGRTRLRVRTSRDVVAPEQVDRGGLPWRTRAGEHRLLAAGFAVSAAAIVFELWTNTENPRDLSTTLVTAMLMMLALGGLWTALWALASRVAFGESRWLRHATILCVVYAVLAVVDRTVTTINGAFGLHLPWSVLELVLLGVAASVALAGHMVTASPMRARFAVAIGVLIPAIAVTTTLWVQARSQSRSPTHIADRDHVVPPALVLRRGLPLDALTARLTGLKATADARRAFVEREDPSPAEDSD